MKNILAILLCIALGALSASASNTNKISSSVEKTQTNNAEISAKKLITRFGLYLKANDLEALSLVQQDLMTPILVEHYTHIDVFIEADQLLDNQLADQIDRQITHTLIEIRDILSYPQIKAMAHFIRGNRGLIDLTPVQVD